MARKNETELEKQERRGKKRIGHEVWVRHNKRQNKWMNETGLVLLWGAWQWHQNR